MNAADEHIVMTRDEQVATITLNRPEARNAVNFAMLERLEKLLDELRSSPPRALLLLATAPAFCAGLDLKDPREAESAHVAVRVRLMHGVLRSIRTFPAPVIVAVDSVAAGLGMELVISADLRLASPAARFSYPEPRVAVPSPAAHLVALIGLARAQEMLLTARWVPAEEAERWGLVARLVADPDVAATELAVEVCRLSPLSLTLTKENLWLAIEPGADAAIEHHIAGVALAAGTRDRREALAAFQERREPRFAGE
jgi:enoyl-CoA hydratase/carnithine racemase